MTWQELRQLAEQALQATEFTVTEDHLTLLRHAYVQWQDTMQGAPEIDPKRPYGSKDLLGSIEEILSPAHDRAFRDRLDDRGQLDDWNEQVGPRLLQLHAETATVLQIGLETGEFRTGTYRRPNSYDHGWRRVEDAQT